MSSLRRLSHACIIATSVCAFTSLANAQQPAAICTKRW
jgi:hypothetical protein